MKKTALIFSLALVMVAVFTSCDDINSKDYVGTWQGNTERDSTTQITMTLGEDGSFVEEIKTTDDSQLVITMTMKGKWMVNGKDIEALIDPSTVNVTADRNDNVEQKNDVDQLKIDIVNELEKRHKDGTRAKFLSSASVVADTLSGTFPTQGSVKLIRVKDEAPDETAQ